MYSWILFCIIKTKMITHLLSPASFPLHNCDNSEIQTICTGYIAIMCLSLLRPCVLLARLLVAVFFQESVGDRTPLLPVHHLIMERIKQWTQTLIWTSSRGSTASGGVTSFANLYLFTAHTNLFCSPFGC